MTTNTKTILHAILAGDTTVTDEQSKGVFALLEGKAEPAPVGRLYTAREVARLVGRTAKTVREWARRGYLVPVKRPGMERVRGYTEASVRALLGESRMGAGVVAAQ